MSDLNASNTTQAKTKGDVFTSFNVADFPVPRGRDEDWIFTPLRRLTGLVDGSFTNTSAPRVTVAELPAGVSFTPADKTDARITGVGAPMDRVGAQAYTAASGAHVLTIADDTVVDGDIVVTIRGAGADTTAFGVLGIVAGRHSQANVILRFEGEGTLADFRTYEVGEGAHLNVALVDKMAAQAVHLSNEQLRLGRDCVLRHGYAAFGGSVARTVAHVSFAAPGADAELSGVYFADDGQFFEQRLLVDHSQPNCRSNVMYKGALQGDPASTLPETRTAWVGDVLIRAEAENTDTYEKNMNLVLSEGARADAVPNLEIATGEIVGAGHAATVGRFDDEHLFYLMSRGIPEPAARRLIVHGFFTEVINRIPIESVRQELEATVAAELDTIDMDELV